MSSALGDRLKQTAPTARQQALEAKATYDRDEAEQKELEDKELRDRLRDKLWRILPESASVQFEGNEAVVDAGTSDALRFAFGCRLIGECSRCSQKAESEEVFSLHQLGMLINEFEPSFQHRLNECGAKDQATTTPAERLLTALREVLQ